MRNELDRETSPYLLQHKDNPVHWQAWNAGTLDLAKRDDRPILLSVGYAACHWCHVMAHECFENPDIAALMNELFVNIKVDREERPDIDTIYQSALALLGQHGGWPLTMFLRPDGQPFWGGTYFPPTSKFGRPGFPDVLRQVAAVYRDAKDKVDQNVAAIGDALSRLSTPTPGGLVTMAATDQIAGELVTQFDRTHGGMAGAPKFPQPAALSFLWRADKRSGTSGCRDAVLLTLDRMCQGGIYDHLGGGFARYSTDAQWLVPHFEKMLYDNAQMLDVLTQAWLDTRSRLYAMRIEETADWVLREMIAAPGDADAAGFAATLDADSEGEEGKFYVWQEAEVDGVLGTDADVFKQAYGVHRFGNWEGKTILNRSHAPDLGDEAHEAVLADCRQRLFTHRETRIRPGWDDKVLADWNGLMIGAMARAGTVFERDDWLAAAQSAFRFVTTRMVDGNRLRHSWRDGRGRHAASLDDYANMCRAALCLHEVTGDIEYLERAEHWVDVLTQHYWDAATGGFFFTADDADDLITRTKTAYDNAVPAGNGTMVDILGRLYYLTGKPHYSDRAETTVAAFSGELSRAAPSMTTLLMGNEILQNADQVVLVGNHNDTETISLRRAVYRQSLPNLVLNAVTDDQLLPDDHPAFGKGQVDGKSTAYLCRGRTCSPPVTEADQLAAILANEQLL